MNRAQMLLARDRITLLCGQLEAMAWGGRLVNPKWVSEKVARIRQDIDELTFAPLAAARERDKSGRFRRG